METIEELKYYCKEEKPVGALMLSGEWGCGKTYLIEHELAKEIENTHIIIRISLFGMRTVEEVKREVNKRWLLSFVADKGKSKKQPQERLKKIEKNSKIAKHILPKIVEYLPRPIKKTGNTLFSLNVTDLIEIKPVIQDKKIILAFDDLERSTIPVSELLGCINDYCENQGFNTIIIANEGEINADDTVKLPYGEIKEKIIQRTVHYTPDYDKITDNIIKDMFGEKDIYGNFLFENIDIIKTIFSGITKDGVLLDNLITTSERTYSNSQEKEQDEEKRSLILKCRSHNIRSMKCALQDFKRVYNVLVDKQIEFKEKWLGSYVTYVMVFRTSGIKENKKDGTLFSEKSISILYPGIYNPRYMTNAIRKWIQTGEWNQEQVDAEFNYIIDRDKAKEPKDIVRTSSLIEIDDEIIRTGFPEVVKMAYNGTLSLDEYVFFIQNVCSAREYNVRIGDIDWKKIQESVCRKIESLLQRGGEQPHIRFGIGENQRNNYTDAEWETYEIINDFQKGSQLMYNSNRKRYLELMNDDFSQFILEMRNMQFDYFSLEMAEATADAFLRANNGLKMRFIEYFGGMLNKCILTQDLELEKTDNGFKALNERLQTICKHYELRDENVAAKHTKKFIEVVDDLIDKIASLRHEIMK